MKKTLLCNILPEEVAAQLKVAGSIYLLPYIR